MGGNANDNKSLVGFTCNLFISNVACAGYVCVMCFFSEASRFSVSSMGHLVLSLAFESSMMLNI